MLRFSFNIKRFFMRDKGIKTESAGEIAHLIKK